MTTVQINGQARSVSAPEDTPLLWVLRDELGMTGTKFGCGMAQCGACTVHVDGVAVRSCVTPSAAVAGRAVSTIEQMQHDRVGRIVQQAWVELNVAQCGYCQAGQIMTAVALLKRTPKPNERQVDDAMNGNICRCGTYPRIRAAIQLSARRLSGEKA
jgi:isoquinoline 1-oxidoreductase alpha subunit